MNNDFIYELIVNAYPNAKCELNYSNELELLIAVILSAQCTDKRVNEVTKCLFNVITDAQSVVNLSSRELERLIYSCGFYRSKAANIKSACNDIILKHNGKVPSTFEELIKLKGVGRKTANVVLSELFKQNRIAVDTHVYRTSIRLGLSQAKNPLGTEKDLIERFFNKDLSALHHALIFHGRYCCKSQNPNCLNCPLTQICTQIKQTKQGKTN